MFCILLRSRYCIHDPEKGFLSIHHVESIIENGIRPHFCALCLCRSLRLEDSLGIESFPKAPVKKSNWVLLYQVCP